MGDEIRGWWAGIPIVTKYLFSSSMGVTLAANFGLVNPMLLLLNVPKIIKGFELWRLITPFCFHGSLGFSFLIHMMFLLQYSRALEQTTFANRTADYVWMLLISSGLLLVIGGFLKVSLLGMGLIMAIIYLWSRKFPDQQMSFMFGIRFKSAYFPWVLIGFNFLMGGFPLLEIVGVVIGHVYFYFEDIYPLATGGRRFLTTPQFLTNFFIQQGLQQPMARGPPQAQQQPRGYQWGAGRPLGT